MVATLLSEIITLSEMTSLNVTCKSKLLFFVKKPNELTGCSLQEFQQTLYSKEEVILDFMWMSVQAVIACVSDCVKVYAGEGGT